MNAPTAVKTVPSAIDYYLDADLREKLHQRANSHMSKLIHSHGMSAATAAPRQLAVCHEVGHAVLNVAHGVEVTSIEVWGRTAVQMLQEEKQRPIRNIERKRLRAAGFDLYDKKWCGITTPGKSPFITDQPYTPYDYIDLDDNTFAHSVQSTLAGIVAEEIYYTAMTNKTVPPSSSLDEIMRAQLACQCRTRNDVPAARRLFEALWKSTGVILIEHQALARRLLAAMQKTDRLEGNALAIIIQC